MQLESSLSRLRRFAVSGWLAIACLGLAGIGIDAAAQNSDTPVASLDNATCLNCHDAKKPKLEGRDAAGKPRPLRPADNSAK
jgi:hypothetical protein